ncbi:MAG: FAD-dependent oxidoreductase [Verrucomicrobiota bacterium]|nr:FAD-dependent oxidoreductase [Verrucomicrobiota bacterium]
MEQADTVPADPLATDTTADVCVVGAGIAGLSVAYHVAQQGRSVIVLDDGPVGGGETGRTTAHLTNAVDDRYFEIERFHGKEGSRLAAGSHTAAIDRIEAIVTAEKIDCAFTRLDGYLFLPPGKSPELLDRELQAAHRAGLSGVARLARAPLDFFDTGPCLQFPRQGQFNPLQYLNGLARAIRRDRGRIYTHAHAIKIEGGRSARVETKNGHAVVSDSVVVATNSPVNDRVAIHTKQAAYRTYAIGAALPGGAVPLGLWWDGFWDSDEPYHYVRLQRATAGAPGADRDILIVGGEDHKTGQADNAAERYAALESWARDRFPMIQEVAFKWSGQVMEPIDGLAFIGRNPLDEPNVYVVTGDSGIGMTHGTIAGILISDLIAGRDNPWARLYDPSRKILRAGGTFARENINVAGQYADWLGPGEISSVDEVASGKGAILRRGLSKIAVYRDASGIVHEHSAVCPHLGCIVRWNSAEETWDCPCHGSRFTALGAVVNGPAGVPLSPAGK